MTIGRGAESELARHEGVNFITAYELLTHRGDQTLIAANIP
jgi:hypothetical protein